MQSDRHIRAYRPEDRARIVMFFERFQQYVAELDPEQRLCCLPGYGEVSTRRTLEDVTAHEGMIFVAVEDALVVGFVVAVLHRQDEEQALSVIPSCPGRITELYVDAPYRRKSVGRHLLAAAEGYLTRQGCDAIKVEVFAPNEPARRLYASLGYAVRDLDLFKRASGTPDKGEANRGEHRRIVD